MKWTSSQFCKCHLKRPAFSQGPEPHLAASVCSICSYASAKISPKGSSICLCRSTKCSRILVAIRTTIQVNSGSPHLLSGSAIDNVCAHTARITFTTGKDDCTSPHKKSSCIWCRVSLSGPPYLWQCVQFSRVCCSFTRRIYYCGCNKTKRSLLPCPVSVQRRL